MCEIHSDEDPLLPELLKLTCLVTEISLKRSQLDDLSHSSTRVSIQGKGRQALHAKRLSQKIGIILSGFLAIFKYRRRKNHEWRVGDPWSGPPDLDDGTTCVHLGPE